MPMNFRNRVQRKKFADRSPPPSASAVPRSRRSLPGSGFEPGAKGDSLFQLPQFDQIEFFIQFGLPMSRICNNLS